MVSGPVTDVESTAVAGGTAESGTGAVEVTDSHEARVGAMTVRRALPRRSRRTVGPWCFLDHMGPASVEPGGGVNIGPHPHTGLQTVTWLLDGEVLHRDSLGSEQVIRPGQLNLMTAGHGVSHAEEGTGAYRGTLHGVQLWVAQPEATRHGEPAFEHHAALPGVDVGAGTATVIVGQLAGAASPARRDTDHLGAELDLRAGRSLLQVDPSFEHALVVLRGALVVAGEPVRPGRLAYLGAGRDELEVVSSEPCRALLIGGVPFPETVLMWWNFVARSRDEITAAYESWRDGDGRFGEVTSSLARIPTGPPPWSSA